MNPLGPLFFLIQEQDIRFSDLSKGLAPNYMVRFLALGFDLRLASPLTKFWNATSFGPGSAYLFTGLQF